MATPAWVSKQLFEDALREYFQNKNIQILGYTSSAAVPAGDNYTSDLFRTSITYGTGQNGNKEKISVIVKCSPDDLNQMNQLVKETQLFEKEAQMYKLTLPEIYAITGEPWTFSAKLIYFTKTPHTIIIFEDLSKLGFQMYDRQQGFDLEHCLLVVEKLACMHAASLVLQEKDPTLVAKYTSGLYSDNAMITGWMKAGFDSIVKGCEKWTGYEKYAVKLAALQDKVVERTLEACKRKLGGFNVLNHGDAWINNFMFSYSPEGKLKDCRIVDYQMVIHSSPAVDLHYFWATSPKMQVQRAHLDTILDRYYAQLLSNLTKFQYSLERVPTRQQFRKDWDSRAFYGLAAAVTILPLVKAPSRQDASFEHLMQEGDDEGGFRHHAYNNEAYKAHMQYLLPFFDDLGVLDCY